MVSVPAEPAAWPKTVGTISIVWALLGLLCGVCGTSWLFMAPRFMAKAEQQFGEPFPDVMKPSVGQMVAGLLGFISPILLMIAGILTVRRRPQGRPVHLLYAVIALILSAVGMVMQVQQQLAIMDWAKHNQSSKW